MPATGRQNPSTLPGRFRAPRGLALSALGLAVAIGITACSGPTTVTASGTVADRTSIQLPDTSVVGMPLTSGVSYSYHTEAIGPLASIDAFAQPGGPNDWIQLQTLFPSGSGTVPYAIGPTDAPGAGIFWTHSDARTFTAGP